MSEDEVEELLRQQYKKRKEKEEKPQKKRDKIVADFIKTNKYLMEIEEERARWNYQTRRNWIWAHAFKFSNPEFLQTLTKSKVSIRTLSDFVFNEAVCKLNFTDREGSS